MSIFDAIGDFGGRVYHRLTGTPSAAELRAQRQAMNQQISDYKKQSELARGELALKKDEQIAEKRRIDEKQIRSLRRNYRASSFLGANEQPAQPGMSSSLGG